MKGSATANKKKLSEQTFELKESHVPFAASATANELVGRHVPVAEIATANGKGLGQQAVPLKGRHVRTAVTAIAKELKGRHVAVVARLHTTSRRRHAQAVATPPRR